MLNDKLTDDIPRRRVFSNLESMNVGGLADNEGKVREYPNKCRHFRQKTYETSIESDMALCVPFCVIAFGRKLMLLA